MTTANAKRQALLAAGWKRRDRSHGSTYQDSAG